MSKLQKMREKYREMNKKERKSRRLKRKSRFEACDLGATVVMGYIGFQTQNSSFICVEG